MKRTTALGLIGLVSLGAHTACGDDDDTVDDVQDANAAFCTGLTA